MDELRNRLANCFQITFPNLPADQIPQASQATVKEWDSIAAITLVNVIEDEFQIQMDLDSIAELDSFARVADYLNGKTAGD